MTLRKNMWFGPKAFHYTCDKRGEACSHSVLGVCVASQEGAKQTARPASSETSKLKSRNSKIKNHREDGGSVGMVPFNQPHMHPV